MNVPKTKNPEKWINDVTVSKKDFMNNKIGDEEMDEYFKRLGLPKAKFTFKDGYAINNETGEKIKL